MARLMGRSGETRVIPFLIGVGVVVIKTPDDIPTIAANVDVFRSGREDQRVQREMRLNKAAMRLRLYDGELYLLRRDAQVEPGRHLRDGKGRDRLRKAFGR
jgi:hypothetical protein